MRSWSRRSEEEPTFVGAALVDAAAGVGAGGHADQVVAFDVAGAARDGGDSVPEALDALLRALAPAAEVRDETLMNALTAVEYAGMRLNDAFVGWTPPAEALADIVGRMLDRGPMLQMQAAAFLAGLAGLAARGLVGEWLGPRGAGLVSRAQRLDR